MKSGKEIKHYKVISLPTSPTPDSVYYVKPNESAEVSAFITNLQGIPYHLFTSGGGGSGTITDITNTDGYLSIVGTDEVFINLSSAMIDLLNSKANNNQVLHTTGDEAKDGNLILNDTLFLPDFAANVGEFNNIVVDETGAVVTIPVESTSTGDVKIIVTNNTGSTINKGSVVYINGAQGSKATIDLALADSNVTTSLAVGITTSTIANNASGYVVIMGEVDNLDTSSFVNGDRVFLSPTTSGELTTTIPTSPNNVVFVGTVTNSHSTQGKIIVNLLHASKLERLVDVAIATPSNGQVITYEASSGLWKNTTLPTVEESNLDHNKLANLQGGRADEYYHLDNSQYGRVLDLIYVNSINSLTNLTAVSEKGVPTAVSLQYNIKTNDDIFTAASINQGVGSVLSGINTGNVIKPAGNFLATTTFTLSMDYTRKGVPTNETKTATYTAVPPKWSSVSAIDTINTYALCSANLSTKNLTTATAMTNTGSAANQYIWFITTNSAASIFDGNNFSQSIGTLNVEDGVSEFYKKSFIMTLQDSTTVTMYSYRTRTLKTFSGNIYRIT